MCRKAGREFGGFGPLTAEEVSSLIGSAFIGAESHYLLGFEKQGMPVRQALRSFGKLIRIAESRVTAQVTSCVPSCPQEGFVERDGVKLYYEVYGDGPQTMVFVPPWSIVHSRVYKAQLPYFSERFRCIAYDGRGNGKSDRPDDVAAYSLDNYVADLLSVMDATGTNQAIIVGLSFGGMITCVVAAHYPERVIAAILAGTSASIGPAYPYLAPDHFLTRQEKFDGWNKYNRAHWLADYPDFAQFFVRNIFSDPHSTRQIEDGIEWAGETTGAVLARIVDARSIASKFDVSEAMYGNIRCPVLVIHGDDDQLQPYARGKAVAEATNAELVPFRRRPQPVGSFPGQVQRADHGFPRSQTWHCQAQKHCRGYERQVCKDEKSALSVLSHRARPRPPRYRHYARTAQASSRPAGRLAGPGPGHEAARSQR